MNMNHSKSLLYGEIKHYVSHIFPSLINQSYCDDKSIAQKLQWLLYENEDLICEIYKCIHDDIYYVHEDLLELINRIFHSFPLGIRYMLYCGITQLSKNRDLHCLNNTHKVEIEEDCKEESITLQSYHLPRDILTVDPKLRKRFDLNEMTILDIDIISCDDVNLCIISLSKGMGIEINKDLQEKRTFLITKQSRVSVSKRLYYQHVCSGSNGVFLRHILLTKTENHPMLLIGDRIIAKDLDIYLQVYDVVSIDVNESSHYSIVILIEGQLIPDEYPNQYHDDGATDIAPDDLEYLASVNAGDELNNEVSSIIPSTYLMRRRYFCLHANIIDSRVIITSMVTVTDSIIIDQRPTTIKSISYKNAIIYGTNGLMFSVDLDQHRMHSLVSDIISYPLKPSSHSISSHITAIDYCKGSDTLGSADSDGYIYFWNNCLYEPMLRFPCINPNPGVRVERLKLSSDGRNIIVCYWDRLLLLSLNQDESNFCLNCILDIVDGYHAIYDVTFHRNGIAIWRMMTSTLVKIHSTTDDICSEEGFTCTHWNQSIDNINSQYPLNFVSECDDEMKVEDTTMMNDLNEISDLCISNNSLDENDDYFYSDTDSLDLLQDDTIQLVFPILPHHHLHDVTNSSSNSQLKVTNRKFTIGPSRNNIPSPRDIYYLSLMKKHFSHESNESFQRIKQLLMIYFAVFDIPTIAIIASAMDIDMYDLIELFQTNTFLCILFDTNNILHVNQYIHLREEFEVDCKEWFTSTNKYHRIGREFWLDISIGHNYLCVLHLKYCCNKSVAIESPFQDYLKHYGHQHLRKCSRGLRSLTTNIRKLDETIGIKDSLPIQIGWITGLQEIYARRVGLKGLIPNELGELSQLRVLSMGNNHLCGELPMTFSKLKKLQRIVLHQNCLSGKVSPVFSELGCIVNLAGNPLLEHGDDVPIIERQALIELFKMTLGYQWNIKTNWNSSKLVATWYKVGVLTSHVHSIVMSSNNMDGTLPTSIGALKHLRMIELATMSSLVGNIPKSLCTITTLRRLCICRCGLTGSIPLEIGNLVSLEELQLFGNSLSGNIPESLGKLINLKLLSLGEYTGGNNFYSNPLPSCLSKLINLEALFMANCNLKGVIPSWISNLKELRQLDLQRNNLSGSIPLAIEQCTNLLYLNLKDNERLSGMIPIRQIASLTKLNRLSLVHCNFQDAENSMEILQTLLPRCKIWI